MGQTAFFNSVEKERIAKVVLQIDHRVGADSKDFRDRQTFRREMTCHVDKGLVFLRRGAKYSDKTIGARKTEIASVRAR